MDLRSMFSVGVGLLTLTAAARCQAVGEESKSKGKPGTAEGASSAGELESQFAEMLRGAVFVGSFQVTNEDGLAGKAALTPPQHEKYEIIDVSKVIDDQWIVRARIVYGEKDVTIPVPVRVIWAGDTPIITVKKMDLPMLGTYAARVMVYRNFYAGTWFGDCYGGILSGQIVKKENVKALSVPEQIKKPE